MSLHMIDILKSWNSPSNAFEMKSTCITFKGKDHSGCGDAPYG